MSYITLKCKGCNCSFEKPLKEYNRRIKNGKLNFYCSQKCSNDSLIKTYNKVCEKCKKSFVATTKQKNKRFCSYKCSNKRTLSTETKQKISSSVKKYNRNNINRNNRNNINRNNSNISYKKTFCLYCNTDITKTRRKYCNTFCMNSYRRRKKSSYQKYKLDCNFNFNLKDYPEEFDFTLIEKYGWYKAKNRGNNLNGVSRDHMYSIREGYNNNIDPYYISHPSNCKLLRHNDNVRKHSKCSITFDELKERVKYWNLKYNNGSVV